MIRALVIRNVKLYFRDRVSVFFSMLGVLVIVGLYVLFLGDMVTGSNADIPGFRFLMNSWIMAGTISVACFTTTLGAFGIMVEDQAKHVIKDFRSSPIPRSYLVLAYLISSVIIGAIMAIITLVVAEIFIVSYGGEVLSFLQLIKVFGLILLSVITSSSVVFFIVSMIKTPNAFGTLSTLVGTLMGFLMGIYVPVGNLPSAVQTFIKVFPISHLGVLFRKVMMEVPIGIVFEGAPSETILQFKEELGVSYLINGSEMPIWDHLLVLGVTIIIFYIISIIIVRIKKSK